MEPFEVVSLQFLSVLLFLPLGGNWFHMFVEEYWNESVNLSTHTKTFLLVETFVILSRQLPQY